VWQTYQKVYESVIHIGSAMRHLGVNPVCCCPIPKCGECVLSLLSRGNCLKIVLKQQQMMEEKRTVEDITKC
jgi:hypothetical protein